MNVKEIRYTFYTQRPYYATEITVTADGVVKQYKIDIDGQISNTPSDQWTVSKKEWNSIVRALSLYGYKMLPDKIQHDGVRDAHSCYIEVVTENEIYKKGGYAAGLGFRNGNFCFEKIRQAIEENIRYSEHR